MIIRRMLRSIPSGNPVSGASVELRLESDNTLLDSTTTDGNGWYQFVLNGNPGPYYITSSFGSEVQRTSSKVVGLSGTTDVGNLGLNFRIYGDGYIPSVLSELAVSASGGSMNVTVAPGAALVRGILYDQFETLQFPIAASTIQPRIDRIVIEVIPAGAGENIEGRSRIVVKTGTPAATPTAPSLTQTTALWQIPLAQVLVDASVVAIASNKVTDERVALSVQIPDDFITTAMLKAKSVTAAKIADNTITAAQLAPDSVGSSELATGAVGYGELANDSVTAVQDCRGVGWGKRDCRRIRYQHRDRQRHDHAGQDELGMATTHPALPQRCRRQLLGRIQYLAHRQLQQRGGDVYVHGVRFRPCDRYQFVRIAAWVGEDSPWRVGSRR